MRRMTRMSRMASGALASSLLTAVLLRGSSYPAEVAKAQKGPATDVLLHKIEKVKKKAGRPGQPFDKPGEAQEFFLRKRSPDGVSPISAQAYLDARERMKGMPSYSTATRALQESRASGSAVSAAGAVGAWQWLGPGNVGGRTRAIVIHPTTASTMYAGGVAGGVWKSTNAGATWQPLADLIANIAVSTLAMTPGQPEVVYAGTGEGFGNVDAVRGAGIFKTTDGGSAWMQLGATATSDFYYVAKIVVSPNAPMRLYAATSTGIHRSTDGGTTWTKVLSQTTNGFTDMVIRTDSVSDVVFASEGNRTAARVYRNTDAGGGGTWDLVLADGTSMGRTSLAIAPSDQSVIYALSANNATGNFQGGLYRVYRSTSGGGVGAWSARWTQDGVATKLGNLLLTNPVMANLVSCGFGAQDSFFNQGWYDNVIAVDPTDPNIIWAGGIELFRSGDGGQNWGQASYWWFAQAHPAYNHADHHSIVFHPGYNGTTNQTMYVGNDGGIHRTNNAKSGSVSSDVCGSSVGTLAWTALNNNYGVTQFYHGAVYPNGLSFFGGTQDNGTVRGTTAAGANAWTPISGGDGGYVAVDPTNTQVLFSETTYLSLQKSTNGGADWSPATSGITESATNFLFIAPFAMDPSSSQRLWIGGWFPWRTTNGATSWTQAGNYLPGAGSASAIAVAPSDANYVLFGMDDGYIARSSSALTTTSATTWASVQPRSGYCSSVAFDPANRDIAYATYSTFGGSHVWKSTTAGASWVAIDGAGATGIPDIPVHSIVVDPTSSQRLYVGTDLGVFVSIDGGANWAVENTGFANVVTEALVTSGNYLYAFTHGRGAYRVSLVATAATSFYTVTPCRLFDTRDSSGVTAAAPALASGETRTFTVGTRCGLSSATVRSLSVNQTVTAPSADGELVLFPSDLGSVPITSNISYRAGKTRANNGILKLSQNGDGTFKVHNRSAGSVHFILDVNGTFR